MKKTKEEKKKEEEGNELVFKTGDILLLLDADESGWGEGQTLDGRIGVFPP